MAEAHFAPAALAELSSVELLRLFERSGDSRPFAEIVRRYTPMVFGTCLKVTRDAHDAEDATQATFLTLAAKGRLSGEIQAPEAWLRKVGHRLSLDLIRSRKRRVNREQARSEMCPEDAPTNSADHAETSEAKRILHEELAKLPAGYRMPLVLHYFGGLSRDEMAEQLKLKPSTLGVRLHRAREQLRKRMKKRGLALPAAAFAVLMTESIRSNVASAIMQGGFGGTATLGATASLGLGLSGAAASAGTGTGATTGVVPILASIQQAVAQVTASLTLHGPVSVKLAVGLALSLGTLGVGSSSTARDFIRQIPQMIRDAVLPANGTDRGPSLQPSFLPSLSQRPDPVDLTPDRSVLATFDAPTLGPVASVKLTPTTSDRVPWLAPRVSPPRPASVRPRFSPATRADRPEPTRVVSGTPVDRTADRAGDPTLASVSSRSWGGGVGSFAASAGGSSNSSRPLPAAPEAAEASPRVVPTSVDFRGGSDRGGRSTDGLNVAAALLGTRGPGTNPLGSDPMTLPTPGAAPLGGGATTPSLSTLDLGTTEPRKPITPTKKTAPRTSTDGALSGVGYVAARDAVGNDADSNDANADDPITAPIGVVGQSATGQVRPANGDARPATATPTSPDRPASGVAAVDEVISFPGTPARLGGLSFADVEPLFVAEAGKVLSGFDPTSPVFAARGTFPAGTLGTTPADPFGTPRAVNAAQIKLHGLDLDSGAESSVVEFVEAVDVTTVGLPVLPSGHTFFGIWTLETAGDFSSAELTVRYDDLLASRLGLNEQVVKLWVADESGWRLLLHDPSFGRDTLRNLVWADAGDFSAFAVSTPEPALIGTLATGLLLLGRRRR